MPRVHASPRDDALRRDVPAARPNGAPVLRDPGWALRGLPPALHRPRADRDARSRQGTLRLRDRERPRPPGACLVERGLTVAAATPGPGPVSGPRAPRPRAGMRAGAGVHPRLPRP